MATENKSYSFSALNAFSSQGIENALFSYNEGGRLPIIVCIGSDLVLGDSLGPLVGTMLRSKGASAYVYGTLNTPITAKEVEYARVYLKKIHPESLVIAVDAAVGGENEVGQIRVLPTGIRPGAGVQKDFLPVGDVSVVGVVASRSINNRNLMSGTRFGFVYRMAEVVSDGLCRYVAGFRKKNGDVSAV